jgi:uncharacterized protein HemX
MTGTGAAILSILVLAAFGLAAGGIYSVAKRRDAKKGALMLVAAAVLIGNVLILTY